VIVFVHIIFPTHFFVCMFVSFDILLFPISILGPSGSPSMFFARWLFTLAASTPSRLFSGCQFVEAV
jgi:hypothetical protein